jgi:hypothetical protein
MTSRSRRKPVTLPAETAAGLAELLSVIDQFLRSGCGSVSLAGWLRSRGAPSPEHDASTLTDWLSFTALAVRDLTAGHDGDQQPQDRP